MSRIRLPKVRTTDFRPGAPAPAATPLAHPPGSHEAIVATYSDELLDAMIADAGSRNLRDQRDHATRWLAQRTSAARAERRRRKALQKVSA